MAQKVIVMGHGYTSRLGVIRALGMAGCYVIVVVMTNDKRLLSGKGRKPIDCHSKYVKEFYYCPNEHTSLINLLLSKFVDKENKVLLFPDSDFTTSAIDLNLNCLSPYFYIPNINATQGEIVIWMDKLVQKTRAEEIGLNVAKGVVIDIDNGKYSIPESIQYPCFTKPLATISGGKKGLKKCENKEELVSVIELLSSLKGSAKVLVEEFLTIEKEYAVVGFCDGNNVIIPGVIHITQMAGSGHFGVARCGDLLPVNEEFYELIELFKEYVRSIGFVGVFDIDFLYSQGKFFFGEMNMRFGGSGSVVTAQGINLPILLVNFLVNGEYILPNFQIVKSSFINERMCVDDWYCGNISSKELKQILSTSSVSFVKDVDDPAPYKSFKRELNILRVKRFIKKILN